jgi:hypothetical protein
MLGGLLALVALVAGAVAIYDEVGRDGDWRENLFGDGEEEGIVAGPSPTALASPEPTATRQPTLPASPQATATVQRTPSPEVTPSARLTPVPTVPGYATPEEAIAAFLQEHDVTYVGDCETASLETDIGKYCSVIWEERADRLIYAVGLAFSEPDTWLLLAQLGGRDDWLVVDFAEIPPAPEEAVPPWP